MMILSLSTTLFTTGGVASVFASFEEEEEEKEEKEREDIPPPPPGVKRQMRFRALDRVQAFKSGGNTFERLDHVGWRGKKTVSCTDDFEEKKTSKESERKRPKMV